MQQALDSIPKSLTRNQINGFDENLVLRILNVVDYNRTQSIDIRNTQYNTQIYQVCKARDKRTGKTVGDIILNKIKSGETPRLKILKVDSSIIETRYPNSLSVVIKSKDFQKNIKSLSLKNVSGDVVTTLSHVITSGNMGGLRELELDSGEYSDQCKWGIAFVKAIESENCPKFLKLNLGRYCIAPQIAIALCNKIQKGDLKTLLALKLSFGQKQTWVSEQLGEALASNNLRSLEVLDLGDMYGKVAVHAGLNSSILNGNFPKIQELYLCGGRVQDSVMQALAEALKNTPELRILDLCNNMIKNAASALADVIKSNDGPKKLRILDLSSNSIPKDGVKALLAQAPLGNLSKLEKLNLNNNNVNGESIKLLVDAAKLMGNLELTHLETLVLSWSCIDKQAIIKLFDAVTLGYFPKLTILDLSYSNMGYGQQEEENAIELADKINTRLCNQFYLDNFKKLQTFNLIGNGICSTSGEIVLNQAMKKDNLGNILF